MSNVEEWKNKNEELHEVKERENEERSRNNKKKCGAARRKRDRK